MPCLAPSEILTGPAAAAFGAVAEAFIAPDYLRFVGRPAYYPRPPGNDFTDISGGLNTALLIAFLKDLHPTLSVSQLAVMSGAGLVKIADIMTFEPPNRSEFYEIKPNSIDGVAAGRTKIALIDAMMTSFGLPYVPGTRYNPDTKIRIYAGMPMGCRLELFFHFKRISPALIVYEICPEGELEKLGFRVLVSVIAATLITLAATATGGGALIPVLAL